MENKRRPILFKGEAYSSPVIKKTGGGPKLPSISFDDARNNILRDIGNIRTEKQKISSVLRTPNEMILCLRMDPDFSAKTYYPATLFDINGAEEEFVEVGSRVWRGMRKESEEAEPEPVMGKLLFVRATDRGLQQFEEALNAEERTQKFEVDVRKLSSLDLLSADEQILGFDQSWEAGRVEAVIHPFAVDQSAALDQFIQIATASGVKQEEIGVARYEAGITFISLVANRALLQAFSGFNPLRVVHPLEIRELPDITRTAPMLGVPNRSPFTGKPTAILGVLDGGYKKGNQYLDDYVDSVDSIGGTALEPFEQHGTMVSAAALYGPLNPYSNSDRLREPPISIRNFRVLSKETLRDKDLFKAIDAIEKIVPANPDIHVYNLSFGPVGEILDDHISRFTFACDRLSMLHDVLFCVAVGNDGDSPFGYDRIQAPSDIVNGLGVGSFTIDKGLKAHAPYSCKGPGREGNKLKPDIVGFGGCEKFPIQLFSNLPGYRNHTYGTSFSSPIISGIATQLVGRSNNQIKSLVARALLIHCATSEDGHCLLMGHGALPDDVSDIISCPDKSYTLVYEDEILSGKYYEYTIPWVNDLVTKGDVGFKWTMAVMTDVNPLSSDDYTSSSIQTTFYPNSKKFQFSKGKKKKNVDIEKHPDVAEQLLKDGWKKSNFPVSKSGPVPYETEGSLRAELKWDSIDHRRKNIRGNDVKSPMFHIHAISRGAKNAGKKVKFALVLTIDAPKASVDVYSRIRAVFPNLLPVQATVMATVKVG